MFNFALILIIAGSITLVGLGVWIYQRRELGVQPELEQKLLSTPETEIEESEAVLIASEYGQVLHVNQKARQWLNVRAGTPSLEYVARNTKPVDNFRSLFTGSPVATFQLGNRWVEGAALQIPTQGEMRTVITLRELTNNGHDNGNHHGANVSASMGIIGEMGETINASQSVEQVMQSMLAIISKNVAISAGEICLWSEKERVLRQAGWLGDAGYVIALASAGGAYKPGEGISGWVARRREALLIPDVDAVDAVQPKLEDNPYRSFVAVPLLLGERFIGTLELTHTTPGMFGQQHLALLQALAKPVATAIYNAQLYSDQIQRIDDIASLQRVTQEHPVDDVAAVYMALHERIASLVDVQVCGVLLYDEQREQLTAQPPFFGLPDGLVRALTIPVGASESVQNIWKRRTTWYSNDLADAPIIEEMGLAPIVVAAGLRNMALLVLNIGDHPIGAIMVANRPTLAGFNNPDIQNMQILAAQAAIVVENVRLFQREQRQDTELVGLQEITHAIGTLSNQDEVYVYSDINTRIAGLMGIQMCGVLLLDEPNQRLVAQLPFYGIADEAVADYSIDLTANEVIESLWEEQEYWYTNRAMADTIVFSAGLADMAEHTGVEKTLVAALTVGGRKTGAIQVSNKFSGEDFTDNDARLLLIFATQAAAIIENARLVREVQRRADEADRLRLIAERAGNLVTMEETLAPILGEVARLTHSQLAFLSVMSSDGKTLVMHPRAIFGAELDQPMRLSTQDPGQMQLAVNTRQPLVANNLQNTDAYHPLIEKLAIERLLIVPMLIGERGLGEVGIANRNSDYGAQDISLLVGVAAQLAATIDRVRLFDTVESNLNRRVQELDAISGVSKVLSDTYDLNVILNAIRREAVNGTGAEGSTIVLVRSLANWDDEDAKITVHARVGEEDAIRGLAEIEQAALATPGEAVIVDHYAQSAMTPQPAGVTSAVALVFSYGGIPVGVIHLQDQREAVFDDRAVSFLQTLALEAAVGFGSAARQYEQVERSRNISQRVEQLNQIFGLGQMLQANVAPAAVLEAIAHSIVTSAGFDVIVITMADPDAGVLRRATQAGLPVEVFKRSQKDVLPLQQVDELFKDDFCISESYFYPVQKIIRWNLPGLAVLSAAYRGNRTMHAEGPNAWRDGDMLLVPINGVGGELLGIMSLDRPQDNKRPDRSQIEVLEIFAHQAATAIENNRLYLDSVRNAENEARLSAMLEDVARTLDIDQIVESVAHNALRLAPFDRLTVALRDPDDTSYTLMRVRVTPGDVITMTQERKATLAHTALGRTAKTGMDYVYTTQNDIGAYKDLTEWYEAGERVSLIVPLRAGGDDLGVMHFGSSSEDSFEVAEFRTILNRIANLTAVAIQNARLFSQAVSLQNFNESVVESIQQGIVVLDQSGRVISANRFMKEEYGWRIEQTGPRKDIFDYSPDLAETLAEPLLAVLETGEPHQVLNLRTPLERGFIARNFYIYPLVAQGTISGAVLLTEDTTERAILEDDIQARANQLSALTRASGKITSSLQRQEVIDLALTTMQDVVDYDTITLWRRIEPETMQLVGERGLNINMSPPIRARVEDVSRMSHVVETSNVMTVDDLEHFLESYPYLLPGDLGAKSWLGVPLIRQGYVNGLIIITKDEPGYYTPQAEQAVMAFANQVAVALANAEMFTDTRARTERLSVLNRVSLALVQSMDSENIFEIALTEISNAMGAEKGRAIVFDRDVQIGRVIVDSPRGDSTPTLQFRLEDSPSYRYILNQLQPLVYSHDRTAMPEPLSDDIRHEVESRGLKDFLLMPMMATGMMIGAFEFETRDKALAIGADTLEIGLIIANQTAIAIQNANQLEEITARTRELETLLEAAQSTSLTMDLEQVFTTVADLMLNTLDVDDCAIMAYDELEEVAIVRIDVNRDGNNERISPVGTRFQLEDYPARLNALRTREAIIINVDDPTADPVELAELREQGDQARMFVPLVARERAIGLIQVAVIDKGRRLTEQERRLARAIGTQVAVAIDNASLSTETANQMEELFIINDLSQAISSTIDVDAMLAIVRDHVPTVTGADEMYVALYNNETEEITFPVVVINGESQTMPPRQLGSDEVSFVIRNRRPLSLDNNYYSADALRSNLKLTNAEGDVKSYLGVPLIAGDEVLGVLAVRDREQTRVFGLNAQRILTTVGSQLGATLQNARLFQRIQSFAEELNETVMARTEELNARTEELEEERDRLDMLYQITAELALTLDMDRVLNRALQMIASAVKAHDGVIMLIDPMTDRLYNRASLSRSAALTPDLQESHPAESLASWLINNDRQLQVDDLHEEPYWDRTAQGAKEWRSAMAVLLETNEDVQGVLVLLSRDVAAFSEPLLNLVIAAANQVASAINNADLYQLIRDQAERLGTLLRNEQEEAEKSSAILEGIADGVMLIDSQESVSLLNSAAEEMLNLDRNDMMGRSLPDLIEFYGDQVAAWAEPVMEWINTASDQENPTSPADRLNVGNRVVSMNIAAVYNGPQYLGAVSVFRDVTRDAEVDRLKNEFVRRATHELRTPLTPIKGYASIMLMADQDLPDKYRTLIEVIKSNADRMADLVEDLLTVSKLDADSNPMNVERFDLGEVVQIQLTNANNRHYGKAIDVSVQVADDMPLVFLDRDKILSVVGNMIDNAFNYTPAGGRIAIELQLQPEDKSRLLLTIADTGVGIAEAFREKVWERFARYEQHVLDMEIPGTGLGLSIVREFVRMHGGEVWFDSEEATGTTFYVDLPIEYRQATRARRT